MKHLVEFMYDNNASLTPKQELLIMGWLKTQNDTKAGDLAFGMKNHISNRLTEKYLMENKIDFK